MNLIRSPRVARLFFILALIFALFGINSIDASAGGKKPRGRAARKASTAREVVRGMRTSRRGHRQVARAGRSRGRVRLSKRELRAERQRAAPEQGTYIAKLQRHTGRELIRRKIAAQMRRFQSGRRRALEEARRRADARQAAIARQRAFDDGLRNEVQANIAKDSTIGEDLEVRNAAVAALGNYAGTVVVMDPRTGRVYTVVNQDWALRRGFKPCSTIKLVTGVAGLSEKIIKPFETVSEGNRIDLTDALAYSNNTFFQQVGGQVGFDKMISYAREMGLGEKTGINHVNESPGRVPLFKFGFGVNRMSSHGDDFKEPQSSWPRWSQP